MGAEVWIAAIGLGTTLIGTAKYMVTKLDDSNKEAISAHKAHLQTFKEEITKVREEYYDTKISNESLKAMVLTMQKNFSDMNTTLKMFVELTRGSMLENEKRFDKLHEEFGKVLIRFKK